MRITTIQINGEPFTYQDEIDDITYETISPISSSEARELLELTKTLFDRKGLKFSLVFGTLLGAVRDKGVIKGDEDVDVFVESEAELRNILPFLQENGLCLCRIYDHLLYSFRVRGGEYYIDIYIKRPISGIWGNWYCYLSKYILPRRLIKNYSPIEFLGGSYLAPQNPECFLEFWYGKSWKVPISGDHSKHGSTLYDKWKSTRGMARVRRIWIIIKTVVKQLVSGEKIY
ncbi:MAG: LicD family protein [Bacteroidales bacterium]|nr:LicD family protein [Bacteroidales bacterium]